MDGELERLFRSHAERVGGLAAKQLLKQYGGEKLSQLDDEARLWLFHWLEQLEIESVL